MDNAPSGVSPLIDCGRWEIEARWVLKVAIIAGDWKEPLYICYLLVSNGTEKTRMGKESTYNVVTIGLINTGPSEW